MAAQYKHKRYFQQIIKEGGDAARDERDASSEVPNTFSGTAQEAWESLGMPAVWDTSSPTKSYALEDSNKTIVVTFEFADEAGQTAFKSAIDSAYSGSTAFPNKMIKHTKTDWLHEDDSVSATASDIVDIPAA